MRSLLASVAILILTCSLAVAQHNAKAKSAPAKPAAGAVPDRALAQKIWDGWCTLNPDNVAAYYDKSAGNVYFDIAPRKYDGWPAYAKGAQAVLSGFQSCKATVNPDFAPHRAGNTVWANATVDVDVVMKDGKNEQLPMRWTAVWQDKRGQWLIVHEHVSVPLPEQPQK